MFLAYFEIESIHLPGCLVVLIAKQETQTTTGREKHMTNMTKITKFHKRLAMGLAVAASLTVLGGESTAEACEAEAVSSNGLSAPCETLTVTGYRDPFLDSYDSLYDIGVFLADESTTSPFQEDLYDIYVGSAATATSNEAIEAAIDALSPAQIEALEEIVIKWLAKFENGEVDEGEFIRGFLQEVFTKVFGMNETYAPYKARMASLGQDVGTSNMTAVAHRFLQYENFGHLAPVSAQFTLNVANAATETCGKFPAGFCDNLEIVAKSQSQKDDYLEEKVAGEWFEDANPRRVEIYERHGSGFDSTATYAGLRRVLAHELGHHFDEMNGWISRSSEFLDAAKDDGLFPDQFPAEILADTVMSIVRGLSPSANPEIFTGTSTRAVVLSYYSPASQAPPSFTPVAQPDYGIEDFDLDFDLEFEFNFYL